MVTAGAQAEPLGSSPEQTDGRVVRTAGREDRTAAQVAIGVHACVWRPSLLPVPCALDASPDLVAAFGDGVSRQLCCRNVRHLHRQIDPVQQRA